MHRTVSNEPGDGSDGRAPTEAWLFAQAVFGKPIPKIVRPEVLAKAKRAELEELARLLPRHAEELRRLQVAEAEARHDRELLEWAAQISTDAADKLRVLQQQEAAEREAWRRAEKFVEMLLEGRSETRQSERRLEQRDKPYLPEIVEWNADQPRQPKGMPQGGQWAPKGGGGGAQSRVTLAATKLPALDGALKATHTGSTSSDPRTRSNSLGGDVKDGGLFRLASASSKDHAIAQAAAKGDLAMLNDLINSGGLSAAERKAAQAAIDHLMDTAQNIISKELEGRVMRRFPREMLRLKLKDIIQLAKAGGPMAEKAKTALKLLRDKRFKK